MIPSLVTISRVFSITADWENAENEKTENKKIIAVSVVRFLKLEELKVQVLVGLCLDSLPLQWLLFGGTSCIKKSCNDMM